MNDVLILGTGNVGTHLAEAFRTAGVETTLVSSRKLEECSLNKYSFIIIAVKDEAISEMSEKIGRILKRQAYASNDQASPVVAHTSGSIPLSTLRMKLPEHIPCGVLYPMQTFSKDVAMRYDDIPFLIEGSDRYAYDRLAELAESISSNIIKADSTVRANYHIGAVLTCNFTNHLCALAEDYLKSEGLDFTTLLPLLRQTLKKLETSSPAKVQTGPAARNDRKVIEYHLDKLADNPELQNIYSILTESIIRRHHPSLPNKN